MRIENDGDLHPGRRSGLGAAASNRRATHPTNALLNYCHTLARSEVTLACCKLGLDPSLGILHRDTARRDSLACDLQETARPAVERYVLGLLGARTFKRSDFLEGPAGEVRLGMTLRQELAGTMGRWVREVAPHAEALRRALAHSVSQEASSRSIELGTAPLTGARRKAAAREVTRRKATAAGVARANKTAMSAIRPWQLPRPAQSSLWSCPDCGGEVTNARHVRCEACIAADPRQTPEFRKSRARAISGRRQAEAAWAAANRAGGPDRDSWEAIRDGLAGVKLSAIVAATGVTKSTASSWRRGHTTPNVMHWRTLAELAEAMSNRRHPLTQGVAPFPSPPYGVNGECAAGP